MAGFTPISPEQGAGIIREGGLVAFPTETVYGLGADAFNPRAVARTFQVKERPLFDPLIVHVAEMGDLDALAHGLSHLASRLIEAFWPGPLTLVLPKRDTVPHIVTAGLETVAVRMPAHQVALQLIRLSQRPITGPSANLFGRISPTTARHVHDQLGDRIEGILDGGPCRVGIESTIISLADPAQPEILRAGGVSVEEIRDVIGPVRIPHGRGGPVQAPGMLLNHYSPGTPLRILEGHQKAPSGGCRAGLLAFKSPGNSQGYEAVEVLSREGDLQEAAANLFAALHRLDGAGLDLILAEPVPRRGLGLAIMDRLERASAK
ncbi:MAG: threonylcarbamoyl-AMP synthase [Deltaproteobacteria bacterium]|nr:threonylcarbamoyl-AMP synthase [Deltaproteobacteria bacterium]MBW2111565.1 threonylcarbamoyl-AMP synthase [Deltaproteobacteria bacterium]MBW2352437.1 threonylcarbamoyl-AMP synthase [Deltaproteobacteria bacterium]HDZ91979.1 threonylcarbamoyl-AMP synthase [Deltaproteobacteria bacterium]